MNSIFKYYLTVVMFVLVLSGIVKGPAFGLEMTIDAIADAGQYAGQPAYVQFVNPNGVLLATVTTTDAPTQWTSSSDVYSYATSHDIPGPWFLESAGNIWSSDTTVGELFTAPDTGVYRISPVDGAFEYDSFGWSPVAGEYLWQLQIYVDVVGGTNYTLGSGTLYDSAALALGAVLGEYMDVTLTAGETLIFWIADGSLSDPPNERNTIDNSGSLTFDVTEIPAPIPEPSTLILVGTGLLYFLRRSLKLFIPSS
jgi:hypothetical protein